MSNKLNFSIIISEIVLQYLLFPACHLCVIEMAMKILQNLIPECSPENVVTTSMTVWTETQQVLDLWCMLFALSQICLFVKSRWRWRMCASRI